MGYVAISCSDPGSWVHHGSETDPNCFRPQNEPIWLPNQSIRNFNTSFLLERNFKKKMLVCQRLNF